MATKTWTGKASALWGTAANWTPEVLPKEEDDIVLEGSKNCETSTTARKCRSLKKGSSYSGTFVLGGTLNIGDGTAGEGSIAFDLTGIAFSTSGTPVLSFQSTSTTQQKINLGSNTIGAIKFEGGVTSSYIMESPIKGIEATALTVLKGVFASNGFTIEQGSVVCNGAQTRTLNIEGSTVKLLNKEGTLWDFSVTTGLTFAAAGSTIEAVRPGGTTGPSETTPLFSGGGKTFGVLKVLNGTPGLGGPALELSGSNTFTTIVNNTAAAGKAIEGAIAATTLTVTSGATSIRRGSLLKGAGVTKGTQVIKELTATTFEISVSQTVSTEAMEVFPPGLLVTAGTTQSTEGLETNGKAGELSRLASATAGTAHTLKKVVTTSTNVSVDFMRIEDSKVDASPKWYAGANSVNDEGKNANWLFEAPPSSGGVAMML